MLSLALLAAAQQKPVDVRVVGHVMKPRKVEASARAMATLKVPAGFKVEKFAEGLGKPRILAVTEDGSVYVTRREPGDLLLLQDVDRDGRADQQRVVAKREQLHGVAVHGNRVFLATVKEVFSAMQNTDGSIGEMKQIIRDLPDGGQHPNRTLFVGPDEMLYVTVGSTCNACAETNDENATIVRTKLDGSERKVFASGLRNTIGMDWHPQTRELWGMDHGIDWLGDNEGEEELNEIVEGAKYGWPYVYNSGKPNPADEPPGGKTHQQWARESKAPALGYTPHAAPMQMIFYRGDQFPPEYRGDAFVTMRGSWNRKPPSGYEVVRIRFREGKPVAIEPFVTGFLSQQGEEWMQFGRPVGLAMMRDGSLLVGDDTNGVIYRVSYEVGAARSRQP